MNVLFLTMLDNMDINRRGIYNDVMRRFRNDGHKVYIVCTVERKMGQKTYVSKDEDVKILHVEPPEDQHCGKGYGAAVH